MQRLLVPILSLILSCGTTGKWLRSSPFRSPFFETAQFGIRKNPISNREYLLFLCWNIEVYGQDYPEHVLNLLPASCIEWDDYLEMKMNGHPSQQALAHLFISASSYFRAYILNAQYLDYPLTGLSRSQIHELNQWLSDRYNENLLIESGYCNFNMEQRKKDSFSLASFLIGQFEPRVTKTLDGKKEERAYWKDYAFLPTFRLPYQQELDSLEKKAPNQAIWQECPFRSNHFLWKWNKHYLAVDLHKREIKLSLEPVSTKTPGEELHIVIRNEPYPFPFPKEWRPKTLSHRAEEFSSCFPLDERRAYPEKNEFGKMPFVVIGETQDGRPLVADAPAFKKEVPVFGEMYWPAFNKRLEFD